MLFRSQHAAGEAGAVVGGRREQGRVEVRGVRSRYSLVDEAAGRYGEENGLWTAQDARGFSAVYGLQGVLAARARARAGES